MAIVGPGPASGGAGAGLRRPGHALALAARLGGLHGGGCALAARRRSLLDPGRPLDQDRAAASASRSTGILPSSFHRSIAKPGSLCRKRPRRAKRSRSTCCSAATPTSTPAAALFRRIAGHYHPFTSEPLDDVPLVELMTALELAAEDLSSMCRQIPGGDMISLSHWRQAVQVAGYINRANDLYSFVLPFLNPVTGLTRLGTREWIVKPAWKSMQQNVLRWFYEAYVNRLGMHLIELMSGRLAIGAHHYRRLTKRPRMGSSGVLGEELKPLTIVVAGAVGAGKSRLIKMIKEACSGQMNLIKAKVAPLGLEPSLLDRLNDVALDRISRLSRGERRREPPWQGAARRRARGRGRLRPLHSRDQRLPALTTRTMLRSPRRGTAGSRSTRSTRFLPRLCVVTGIDRPEFGGGSTTAARRNFHTRASRVADPRQVRVAPVDCCRSAFTTMRRSAWARKRRSRSSNTSFRLSRRYCSKPSAPRSCAGCTKSRVARAWAGSCSKSASTASRSGARSRRAEKRAARLDDR